MELQLINFLMGLAQNQPWLLGAAVVISVARAVFKPLIAVLDAYVLSTPAKADDEWVREFKTGKVYWALDYVLSIKIPEKPKDV